MIHGSSILGKVGFRPGPQMAINTFTPSHALASSTISAGMETKMVLLAECGPYKIYAVGLITPDSVWSLENLEEPT